MTTITTSGSTTTVTSGAGSSSVVLPPTGASSGALPTSSGSLGASTDPYADKLAQFLEYFGDVTTSDTGAMVNFAEYITNLAQGLKSGAPLPGGGTVPPAPATGTTSFKVAGVSYTVNSSGVSTYVPLLDDPTLKDMLNAAGIPNITKMLGSALSQIEDYSMLENGGALSTTLISSLNSLANVLACDLAEVDTNYANDGVVYTYSPGTTVINGTSNDGADSIAINPMPITVDSSNNVIVTAQDAGGNTVTYNWTTPTILLPNGTPSPYGDQFMIETLIGGQGVNACEGLVGTSSTTGTLNTALQAYKTDGLNGLLTKFPGQIFAVLLWFMSYSDSSAQAQESGENQQESVISNVVTDNFANSLQALSSSAGSWSTTQVVQLQQLLQDSSVFMANSPQASTIASNWNSNVYAEIANITVPATTVANSTGITSSMSLVQYLDTTNSASNGITLSTKMNALNILFNPNAPATVSSTSTSPAGSTYAANTNYQALVQATTTAAQLGNGQSQNVTTELGTLSALESAVDQTFDQVVDQKTGLNAMMLAFVQAQVSH